MLSCYGCMYKNTSVCTGCVGWSNYESNTLMNPALAMDIDKEMKMLAKAGLNNLFGVKNAERKTDMRIEKVIFNYPATVVIWKDGTKTIVKAGDHDVFDPEKGLAMAIAKKALGNQGNYYEVFKKWLPEEDKFKELPESLKPTIDEWTAAIKEIERYEEEEEDKAPEIQWLSTKQVADMNNISVECVRKQIKDGLIPSAEKVDGKWQIPCCVFDDHVEVKIV